MLMDLLHWIVRIAKIKYVVKLCISIYFGSEIIKTPRFGILIAFQDRWTISQKPTFDWSSINLKVNSKIVVLSVSGPLELL